MSKQDFMGVRNFSDVQKELLGLKKNLIYSSNTLLKVNNEINNILTSLIINLKDVLGSQSEISLWFYSGVPTTSNNPYTSWTTTSEHYGDIYYDQATGKVYQYDISGWTENQDNSLIQAMALTNSQLTSNDHERKVFFDTPITPYDSGDWWIQDNGILYICQLGKVSTLTYEENDWIPSNQYTTTVAIKDGNRTTVLEGTVTQITKDYVKFTDLSTGGSTTIAGENITTGVIKSSNYVANSTGTSINLNTGVIDTKNFKVDQSGNVSLLNGSQIITDNGLMTNLHILSEYGEGYLELGPISTEEGNSFISNRLNFSIFIPSNFKVKSAYIILQHVPILEDIESSGSTTKAAGYARSIQAYLQNYPNQYYKSILASSYDFLSQSTDAQKLTNIFDNSDTWNPKTFTGSNGTLETKQTSDISSYISSGLNLICIKSGETYASPSSFSSDVDRAVYMTQHTGLILGHIEIYGYMKN